MSDYVFKEMPSYLESELRKSENMKQKTEKIKQDFLIHKQEIEKEKNELDLILLKSKNMQELIKQLQDPEEKAKLEKTVDSWTKSQIKLLTEDQVEKQNKSEIQYLVDAGGESYLIDILDIDKISISDVNFSDRIEFRLSFGKYEGRTSYITFQNKEKRDEIKGKLIAEIKKVNPKIKTIS